MSHPIFPSPSSRLSSTAVPVQTTWHVASDLRVLGQTEAEIEVAARAGVPGTIGGMQEPRSVMPGTAPNHSQAAVTTHPGAAIRRGTYVTAVPAILYPLPHIAMHVLQAPSVGRKTPYRRSPVTTPATAATIAIGPVATDAVAPTVLRAAPGPGPILPLRFRQ